MNTRASLYNIFQTRSALLKRKFWFSRFLAVVPSLADSSESVSGQRPNTSVEQG